MSNGNTRHDAATRFVADACSKITILIGVVGLANWLFAYVTEKMLLPNFATTRAFLIPISTPKPEQYPTNALFEDH